MVDDFAQVTSREVLDYLSQSTDTTRLVPVVFAIDDIYDRVMQSHKDIQSRTNGKVRTFKGVKAPKSLLQKDVFAKIGEHCGISKRASDKAEAQPLVLAPVQLVFLMPTQITVKKRTQLPPKLQKWMNLF